jgi:hypothetical protein
VVDPQPVSVSTRTISVTNASTRGNVSITIPSNRDASIWRGLLQRTGDLDRSGTESDAYVYNVTPHPSRDAVVLHFERDETYQLKLSKVEIGTGAGDTERAYLTSIEDPPAEPFVNRTYPFVVESRDKYNNPIGTDVTVSQPAGGTVRGGTVVEPGQYRYQYEPTRTGPDTIQASYNESNLGNGFVGDDPENVEYNVTVQANVGGGGGGGGNADSQVEYVGGSAATVGGGSGVQFDIKNTGGSGVTITAIAVNSTTDSTATSISAPGGSGEVLVDNTEVVNNDFQIGGSEQGFAPSQDIGGGSTSTFEVRRFTDGGGNDIDMSGDNITITLFFDDGSKKAYTIDP